jgi:hypothetical protein
MVSKNRVISRWKSEEVLYLLTALLFGCLGPTSHAFKF